MGDETPLYFTEMQHGTVYVDVGDLFYVRKGWSGVYEEFKAAEIKQLHCSGLDVSLAERMVRELQRAIEVARKLDENPSWRGE